MYEQHVYNALSTNNFLIVNKSLLKHLGGDSTTAIVLTELILKHQFYKNNHQLDRSGLFYCTLKTLEDSLGIKRGAQDRALRKLISADILYVENKGFPKKRYFEIQFKKLFEIVGSENNKVEKSKVEFFAKINDASSYAEWLIAKGNIKEAMSKAMWLTKIKTGVVFNSKDFAMLKYYLLARFKGKPWDYSMFDKAKLSKGMSISGVIDSLRCIESNSNTDEIVLMNKNMDKLYFS